MTNIAPLYLKQIFKQDPYFAESKIVCSIYDEGFEGSLDKRMAEKMKLDGISEESVATIAQPTFNALNLLAIENADGLIVGSEDLSEDIVKAMKDSGLPILNYHGEEGYVGDINNFYDSILEGKAEAVS
jgi:starch synthase